MIETFTSNMEAQALGFKHDLAIGYGIFMHVP
jgi:hypothetical protein